MKTDTNTPAIHGEISVNKPISERPTKPKFKNFTYFYSFKLYILRYVYAPYVNFWNMIFSSVERIWVEFPLINQVAKVYV